MGQKGTSKKKSQKAREGSVLGSREGQEKMEGGIKADCKHIGRFGGKCRRERVTGLTGRGEGGGAKREKREDPHRESGNIIKERPKVWCLTPATHNFA